MKMTFILAACSIFLQLSVKAVETVRSEVDLISILEETQKSYQGISPPSENVFVTKSSVAFPVDWSGFSKKTTKYMTAYMDKYGLPRYAVLIYEDAVTRDRVITLASSGYELARIASPKNYVAEAFYTGLLSRGASYSEFTRWVFDPAHTAVEIELIPEVLYSSYETYEAQAAVTESMMMTMSVPMPPDNTTAGEPPVTVTTTNSDVTFTIPLPVDFGGHAEIFKTTNLQYIDWWVEENRTPVTGGTDFSWTDAGSSNQNVGYYIFSPADADFDGDGYSDLREQYIEESNPESFDMVDVDTDGMHDWYEITLLGGIGASPNGDADGDDLKNSEEMILHPAIGTNSAYITFNSQPDKYDTDGDGMNDKLETITYPFLDPNDPSDWDYDQDGISNIVEITFGTYIDNWDSDNDTLPDGIEYGWDASDPRYWDDINYDGDNDGLSLYEEYQHGTQPDKGDSDNDGTNDGDEVGQGGNPTDSSDNGEEPEESDVIELKLTIGDHSGSRSEIYEMTVKGDRTIRLHSGNAGNVEAKNYFFKKGTNYTVSIKHVGSDRETPDYDYTAKIELIDSASAQTQSAPLAEGIDHFLAIQSASANSGTIIVEDPSGWMGVVNNSSSVFKASGKTAKVIIPKVTLKMSQSTMTLKHDNTCLLEVETAPDNLHFSQEKIEIRWSGSNTWHTLYNGETIDWEAKVAGQFKLRASATAMSIYTVESSEKSATVQFPDWSEIIQDPDVQARGGIAWQSTKKATTPVSRREEGYYITLDTSDGTYGDTDHSVGAAVGNDVRPFWDTATVPRPADSIANPSPLDELVYVVGWMHTHTPALYTTNGRWPGHSGSDQVFSVQSGIQIPGFVCDYTGNSTNYVPQGWPIDSPAEFYWVEVMIRRQL